MESVIEVKDLDEAKLHVGKKAYAIGQNLAYFLRHNEKPSVTSYRIRPNTFFTSRIVTGDRNSTSITRPS